MSVIEAAAPALAALIDGLIGLSDERLGRLYEALREGPRTAERIAAERALEGRTKRREVVAGGWRYAWNKGDGAVRRLPAALAVPAAPRCRQAARLSKLMGATAGGGKRRKTGGRYHGDTEDS